MKLATGHECAQAGCDAEATQIIVESHPLALLFSRTGAGLVCDKHARAMEAVGGVRVPIEELSPREEPA